MPDKELRVRELSYSAPLISNIRQILTGLQGFDSMAREIIQNADDAGAKCIRFDIKDDALIVWNDAEFLSCGLNSDGCPWATDGSPQLGKRKSCDFHAISKVGSGNKYNQPGLIGRFGIGFVSVYQLTDQPIIRSGDVELRLNPLSEKNQVITIGSIKGTEFELGWALDDRGPVREALSYSAFSLDSLGRLQNGLVRTAEECLLFLRSLESIEILRNGNRVSLVRKVVSDKNHVDLYFREDKCEKWYVIHLDAEEAARPLKEKFAVIEKLDRQTTAQIAFRLGDHEERAGRLFAYLPTEQDSPVPCHINADFFPEQTRRTLVLKGDAHESRWNEMLLGYVAREIASRLEDLRDVLGPMGLWRLVDEAYQNRNNAHFEVFWKEISAAARDAEVYWTSSKGWAHRPDCKILPSGYGTEHKVALEKIGIVTINSSMRLFKSAMVEIGVASLTFANLVDALKSWEVATVDQVSEADWPRLREIVSPIWRVLDNFLESTATEKPKQKLGIISNLERDLQRQIRKLCSVRMAPRSDGHLANLAGLKRLPPRAKSEEVSSYFIGLPLVSEEIEQFPQLCALVPELGFKDLLNELAERVNDEETAISFLSADKKRVREFYDFLAEYPRDVNEDYSAVVALTPFLAGHGRFLTPQLAVLPGGFDDPIGRFDTLDLEYFGDRARKFLKEILKVETLTLQAYIDEHLADILDEGLEDDQYIALLEMLVSKKDLLDKEGMKETLAALPLVRTKDVLLRPVGECYSKTDSLAEILGDDDSLWVDESIFASSRLKTYLGFLQSLGLRERPSLSHALDGIEAIVVDPPSDKTRGAISKIFGFLLDVYQDESLAEKEGEFEDEILRIRHTNWLPAKNEGKLDTESWYAPHELYQPFRSGGFASQVAVLDLHGMGRRLNREFLEFLEMPAEPDTSTVVQHLEECIERGVEPNRHTYQILNERLKKEDGTFFIERLKGQKCIYAPNKKKFFGTERFFWSKPNLPRYCFKALEWMHDYKELFDALGVAEEPTTQTYVDVLIDIAKEFGGAASGLLGDISLVHEICIRTLSDKLHEDPSNTSQLLEQLREHPFLLTLAGTLAFVDEVAVKNSDWVEEPFGGDLNAFLLRSAPETTELTAWFKIRPLSSVTRLEMVALGNVLDDEEATHLLRDRSDLLGWLCSDLKRETRSRIEKSLREIELVRTDALSVRSVFQLDDIPYSSAQREEDVVFDADETKVYVLLDLKGSHWIPSFRAIFSTLLAGENKVDIRTWSIVAANVLKATSREDAAHELRQAGYEPTEVEDRRTEELLEDDLGELEFGTEPEEASPDWNVEDEPVIDDADGGTDRPASNAHIAEEARKKVAGAGSSGTGEPGAKQGERSSGPASSTASGLNSGSGPTDKDAKKSTGKARTEWMRSYVKPKNAETDESGKGSVASPERISEIDEAAMKTVMDYEVNRGFAPERQPHYNPGFDVLSRSKNTDEKRLIEVKGLAGEWTDRGVKLSRTQISFAQAHPEEAWLYVVENALDPKIRKINAIKNLFFKADEFWFDRVWREVAEENGGDYKSQFVTGRRIKTENFGVGTIIDTKTAGHFIHLTVEFKDWGKKSIPFNATTMEIIED